MQHIYLNQHVQIYETNTFDVEENIHIFLQYKIYFNIYQTAKELKIIRNKLILYDEEC